MKQGSTPYVKRLSGTTVIRPLLYCFAGAVFSGGTFIFSSHPFGIALVSAVTGFPCAAAAVCGALIGCLRLSNSTVYAASVSIVFIFRLVLGRWLSPPEHREEISTGLSAPARFLFRIRRYATEASEVSFREARLVRMLLSSAAAVSAGGIVSASGGYRMEDIVSTVATALTAPILVYLYSGVGSSSGSSQMAAESGRCAFAASFVVSLSGLVPYIDIAPAAAFVIVLLASKSGGTLVGVVYGVICGAVLSPELSPLLALTAIASGCLWRVSAAVAVTGACTAGILWGLYIWGLDAMSTVTPGFIVASVIMAPLLSSGVIPLPVKNTGDSPDEMGENVSSYMLRGAERSKRIRTLSESMSDIAGVLYNLSDSLTTPDTEELAEICESAFMDHCSKCGMKNSCYGMEARRTEEVQARMTLQLRSEGRVSASVVPQDMARRCYCMGEIIDKMNQIVSKRIAEAKLYDRTLVVAADYEVMSDVLRESSEYDSEDYECDRELTKALRDNLHGSALSAENIAVFGRRIKRVVARGINMDSGVLGADDIKSLISSACSIPFSTPEFELDGAQIIMKLRMSPRLTVRCGRASVALSELRREPIRSDDTHNSSDAATRIFSPGTGRSGLGLTASEECGDVISAFCTDDERFFMLISDGMGSGREAAVTSGVCAVFLERMLCAGASMDTALKMLNSMMRVRKGECSATVDLMELDLINGHTRFVKSGAAPSFVLRRGRLFRLQSKTVPIGIVRALDAEMIKFETEPGDIVIMLSDGVARSFEDCPWLFDLLCDPAGWVDDPERMARRIVKCAIQNGGADDITAGVVYIE